MPSSIRVLSGSQTKGSTAIPAGPESAYTNFDHFKQGVNIHTLNDLSAGLGTKIRSNSELVRALSRKKLESNFYDDTKSPVILSGSNIEISSPEVAGKFEYYINHAQEKRDLGQTLYYENNEPYKDSINPDNPIEIMSVKIDLHSVMPFSLVDNASLSSFDGKIDVMEIFKSTDGSTTDFPFNARGVRGSYGNNENFLRQGQDIESRTVSPGSSDYIAASHYLDAPENFGDVLVPSVMNFHSPTLKPFEDVSGDVEHYLNSANVFTEEGNSDIRSLLISASFTVDDSRGTFDRMTVGGFDYEDGDTDSILFGGLIR